MKCFFIFLVVFLSTVTVSFCTKCESLDAKLQKLCNTAGYNLTASFPAENGLPRYQNKVYSEIRESQRWYSKCSKLSSLMVCSRYVPKCLQTKGLPILPCRDVCEEFVHNCAITLEEKKQKRWYISFCHLLPVFKNNQQKCLRPKGFSRSSNAVETLPKCPSSVSLCLKNISLTSKPDDLQLSEQCLESLKRIACYTQSTPCLNNGAPYLPCRSFCDGVLKSCFKERAQSNVTLTELTCSALPDNGRNGDLCRMERWPVPWPQHTKDNVTCYCDSCGPKKLCQTNGSCFIQSLLTNKGITNERTCLHPGKRRDFICQHVEGYDYGRCCREDGCNKELHVMLTTPTTQPNTYTIPRKYIELKTEEKAPLEKTQILQVTEHPTINAHKNTASPTVLNGHSNANTEATNNVFITVSIAILSGMILQNQQE